MTTAGGPVNGIDWSSPSSDYRRVFRYAVMLALVALAITPFAGVEFGPSYPLVGMLLAASIMGTAITAFLLLVQARTMHSLPTAVLATGFLYAAATMLPYSLLYRGMFPALVQAIGANPSGHEYLWFFWQAGFLIALLSYQRLRLADGTAAGARALGRRVIAALTIAYMVLTPSAIWIRNLPETIQDGRFTPLFTVFIAPLIVILAAAVLLETIRRRHRTSVLEAWIAIVAVSMLIEVYLTLVGVTRFTLGWYAGRVIMLLATTALLAVMLLRATRMYVELIERANVLEGEAHTDILTGLANRRRFDEEFERAFGSAIRRASPLAVAIIDIDHFKDYNDAFGHQAGDDALRAIAHAIGESVERSGDFAARYGGEEFVVILEDTTLGGALGVAERIRNAVLEERIRAPVGGLLSVSLGVAARLPGSTGELLLRQADAALYEAKNAGRNRVAAWRSPQITPIGSPFEDPQLAD